MFKIKIQKFLIVALAATVLVSCKKKDKDPEPEPEKTVQNMSFHFTTMANNMPLNLVNSYTTSAGARFKIETYRYYVSNIRLVRDNGSEYAVSGKVLLVNTNTLNYDLGEVPIDSYIGVRFMIGLDSLTNHKDPTAYSSGNPLAIQSPGIHWSWNSGYIFMMTEGSCDTTATNTDVLNALGQYNHSMFFHIGTDALRRNVDLQRHFHVTGDAPYVLKITADLNVMLKNVDIKTQNKSHTFGTVSLATMIADNISTMFTVTP